MKIPEFCRYCGGKVILTDASVLFGPKISGEIYLCTNCNASVGVHSGTTKPMGTLANKVLSLERAEVHRVFDALWKASGLTRKKAYAWLAKEMGLPKHRAHVGCFEIEECEKALRLCREHEKIKEAV